MAAANRHIGGCPRRSWALALLVIGLAGLGLPSGAWAAGCPSPAVLSQDGTTCTATFTGPQTYTVPAGVTSLSIAVDGGAGGFDANADVDGTVPGMGGEETGSLPVKPDQTLSLVVGGQGGTGGDPVGGVPTGLGGLGGGGNGSPNTGAGGGGGGSFVFDSTGTLLLAAGGGGGSGNNSFDGTSGGNGGNGGGVTGALPGTAGIDPIPGSDPGLVAAGGAAAGTSGGAGGADGTLGCSGGVVQPTPSGGTPAGAGSGPASGPSSLGLGGNASAPSTTVCKGTGGGGGGGGYFGGGGGGSASVAGGGGGGGSGFVATSVVNPVSAVAQTYNGQITISFPIGGIEVVNSTGDQQQVVYDNNCDTGDTVTVSGNPVPECTLRAAIQNAEAQGGAWTINFDIPGGGVPQIDVPNSLPAITQPLAIDGTTQPGGQVELKNTCSGLIETDCPGGASVDPVDYTVDGFLITGGGATIRGFALDGFADAVKVVNGGANTVQHNVITPRQPPASNLSSDSVESCSFASSTLGGQGEEYKYETGGIVVVNSSNNQIGGTGPGQGNQIVGVASSPSTGFQPGCGIIVRDDYQVSGRGVILDPTSLMGAIGNAIEGNTISGAVPSSGLPDGEGILVAAPSNTVADNTLSNLGSGIDLYQGPNNVIQANQITGLAGILLDDARQTTIGGSGSGVGNTVVVTRAGISITDGVGDVIQQNAITVGTDVGDTGIAAVTGGDLIGGSSDQLGNTVTGGGPENGGPGGGIFVGGTDITVEHNTVTGSQGSGVVVAPGTGLDRDHNDLIRANVLWNDEPLAIDLGGTGIPANNDLTESTGLPGGPNDGQNFPILTQAGVSGTTATVTGFLESVANQSTRSSST